MNTRTNLRNWRNESTYIISVSMVGTKTKHPYIAARLEAITATQYHINNIVAGMKMLISGNDRIYTIAHDRSHGISSPQSAVDEAVRRYKVEMNIN